MCIDWILCIFFVFCISGGYSDKVVSPGSNFKKYIIECHYQLLITIPIIMGIYFSRNFHHQFCLDQQDGENNVGLPILVFDCTNQKVIEPLDGEIKKKVE